MSYDSNNIFAKILRGELPCKKIYEDEHVLAINDINPKASTHILVLPKKPYITLADFSGQASDAELIAFNRAIAKIIESSGLQEKGCRLISNNGKHGRQEVPHFHVHILGGHDLGIPYAVNLN